MNSRHSLCVVSLVFGLVCTTGLRGYSQDTPSSKLKDEVGARYYIFPGREFGWGGWMPDGEIPLAQSTKCRTGKPHSGAFFYRAKCDLGKNYPWMAVALLPGGKFEPIKKINVVNKLGGVSDNEHIVLRFYARSLNEASVQFKVGGYDDDSVDFAVKAIDPKTNNTWITLGREWQLIEVDLTEHDLTGLRGALTWVVDRDHDGEKIVEFHLDEIYYVKVKSKSE